MSRCCRPLSDFFFNDTATTEIYTLSLHDALPISLVSKEIKVEAVQVKGLRAAIVRDRSGRLNIADLIPTQSSSGDRKSTRLNSSHANISYAVFCLKKKHTHYECAVIVC